jgi:hypothetical protein
MFETCKAIGALKICGAQPQIENIVVVFIKLEKWGGWNGSPSACVAKRHLENIGISAETVEMPRDGHVLQVTSIRQPGATRIDHIFGRF